MTSTGRDVSRIIAPIPHDPVQRATWVSDAYVIDRMFGFFCHFVTATHSTIAHLVLTYSARASPGGVRPVSPFAARGVRGCLHWR